MSEKEKIHWRKAFNSPYLSSGDLVGPTVLTIAKVEYELDASKRTKDFFNVAYFKEKEIRPGEKLKPMVLNVGNSRIVRSFATGEDDAAYIRDWKNILVTVFVDPTVKIGHETVGGLRIMPMQPKAAKPQLTPEHANWGSAIEAYKRDGNLNKVLERVTISAQNQKLIIEAAKK